MRPNQTLTTFPRLVMVMSSVLLACADDMASRNPNVGPIAIEIGYTKATTNGDVAANNLRAQADSLEQQLSRQPESLSIRLTLVDTLLMRTQFLGLYQDFERALELAEETSLLHPESDAAKQSLARVLGAVHRFDEAIEITRTLPDTLENRARKAGYAAAKGLDYEANLAVKQMAFERKASFQTITDLAHAQSTLGNFDAADQLYLKALAVYRDVSPFPVAWVMFQRGLMWAEQADQAEKALILYREAVSRLPTYVVASVHLAELEDEIGRRDEALRLLANVLDQTQDPEPAGFLAELLPQSEAELASQLVERATNTYERLLSKHRAAFADHGSEFFSGPGSDVERGLSLALFNLERRDTDRAYKVAIEAAVNADEIALACELRKRALARESKPALLSLLYELEPSCNTVN